MFSPQRRCIYRTNPLAEVICQLRFPEILSIGTVPPAEFQEAIRAQFPGYAKLQEISMPKVQGLPGSFSMQRPEPTVNHRFLSSDGAVKVNLTSKFISVSTSNYTCWEDFARHLDKPLAEFIRIYQPASFQRIGLRYVNFISRQALQLEGTPFRDMIQPTWLGPLATEGIREENCQRCTTDCEFSLPGGCRVKIHAGPGRVKRMGKPDNELKFIFDQDIFMQGNIPLNASAGALQILHSHSYPIFRGAITDLVHRQMGPGQNP